MKLYSIIKRKLIYVFLILIFLFSFIDYNLYLCISLIISVIYTLFFFKECKYDWRYWTVIFLLGAIVLVGMTRFNNSCYDYGKDLFYFIRPIIIFTLGYVLIQSFPLKKIVCIVVYFVLIFAFIHVVLAVYYLMNYPLNIEGIRNALGRGYILETFAIYFLLLKKECSFSFKSKYAIVYLLIIFTSFLFYLSRTNIVILFVLLLFTFPKISIKKIYYIPISLLFVSSVLLYNYNMLIWEGVGESKSGVKLFYDKILNSKQEILSQNINEASLKELYTHWRAYEVKCALEQTKNIVIGNGFGALVDIHFPVFLGKEKMRFIPIIHNGYMYIIFKTGIIGCVFYLLFIFIQLWKRNNISDISIYYFQIGLMVSIILMTFVVTGIYGKTDLSILFLGIVLGVQLKKII